jgi:hypothetical protein
MKYLNAFLAEPTPLPREEAGDGPQNFQRSHPQAPLKPPKPSAVPAEGGSGGFGGAPGVGSETVRAGRAEVAPAELPVGMGWDQAAADAVLGRCVALLDRALAIGGRADTEVRRGAVATYRSVVEDLHARRDPCLLTEAVAWVRAKLDRWGPDWQPKPASVLRSTRPGQESPATAAAPGAEGQGGEESAGEGVEAPLSPLCPVCGQELDEEGACAPPCRYDLAEEVGRREQERRQAERLEREFRKLLRLEPRLGALRVEAQQWHRDPDPHFCANGVWAGWPDYAVGFERRVETLVGRRAPADAAAELRTQEAYEVACEAIYRALPDCRRCSCGSPVIEAETLYHVLPAGWRAARGGDGDGESGKG